MKKSFAVFHLNDERMIKGGERQMLYLACQLRAMGHWNCIVCRKGSALDKLAEAAGFNRIYLPYLFEWDPLSAGLLMRQIHETEKTVKPAAVILHAHTAHAAGIAYMTDLKCNCVRVAHRREDFPLSNSLSVNAKYSSADRVIAVSDSIKRILMASGVPPDKIAVIRDSIPADGFPWDAAGLAEYRKASRAKLFKELDIPEDASVSGALLSFIAHKDPVSYLKSIPAVLKEVPWTHFVLAGDGPLLKELKTLSFQLKITHRLHFLEHCGEPFEALAALDVFVMPSWGEGMGSLILEAMAVGTPVVATKIGVAPEIVEDGVSGCLARPRTPDELAAAQARLLKDTQLREKIIKGAFAKIKKFQAEDAARAVLAVYDPAP